MKKIYLYTIICFLTSLYAVNVNAQDKFYVPDLLYLNDDFYTSGRSMECFDNNENTADYTMSSLKYCLFYKTNENREKVLEKRIEQVGEKWIVTDLILNKQISYKPNKEIIVEKDEINGFHESGDLVSYKIYYYKTEIE